MLEGKVSAAMKWIGDQKSSILQTTPDVIEDLLSKHPNGEAASVASVLEGPIVKVEEVIFE